MILVFKKFENIISLAKEQVLVRLKPCHSAKILVHMPKILVTLGAISITTKISVQP